MNNYLTFGANNESGLVSRIALTQVFPVNAITTQPETTEAPTTVSMTEVPTTVSMTEVPTTVSMTIEAPTTDTVAMTTEAPTTSITVSLTLEDIPPDFPDFLCIGGNEVGLTNTSVQFQYRSISTTSVIGDWITLDLLPVNRTSDITHNLEFDGTVGGVQFRLLQLEHGGGGCNCWDVQSSSEGLFNDHCFRVSPIEDEFCGGNARDVRGIISGARYFNTLTPGVRRDNCPGDSGSELVSNKGPPLPQNCSTAIPRM